VKNKTVDYIIKNIIEKEIELNLAYNEKNKLGEGLYPTFMMDISDINDIHKRIIKKIKKHFK
jgi:hypothetical protein